MPSRYNINKKRALEERGRKMANARWAAGLPYCMDCGGEMRPNVPRMGWDGGAVHVENSGLNCPSQPIRTSLNTMTKEKTNTERSWANLMLPESMTPDGYHNEPAPTTPVIIDPKVFKLVNVLTNAASDSSSTYFTADVKFMGKTVAQVSDDGNGGCIRVYSPECARNSYEAMLAWINGLPMVSSYEMIWYGKRTVVNIGQEMLFDFDFPAQPVTLDYLCSSFVMQKIEREELRKYKNAEVVSLPNMLGLRQGVKDPQVKAEDIINDKFFYFPCHHNMRHGSTVIDKKPVDGTRRIGEVEVAQDDFISVILHDGALIGGTPDKFEPYMHI